MFLLIVFSMRVDYGMHIKNLDNSNNALLNKRKNREQTNDNGAQASGSSVTKF